MSGVRRIEPKFVPKIWGSRELEPWFRNADEPIGEVWFPAGELLIKFLFTTDNLSVQVHPGDEYAARHEQSRGKTEMWHILRAATDAKVALGFSRPMDREKFKNAAESGAIVDELAWMPARPGDTFFVPAGTVHAIGAGLALCEIQQNSDVTYRVFDYGRARGLHLDKAMEVSDFGKHAGASAPRANGEGSELLAEGPYFVTRKVRVDSVRDLARGYMVVLDGAGRIDGQLFAPGSVWELEVGRARVEPDGPVTILTTKSL